MPSPPNTCGACSYFFFHKFIIIKLFMWKLIFSYGCLILRGMIFKKAANITRITIKLWEVFLCVMVMCKFWIEVFRKINVWADGDIYLRKAEFIIWLGLGISSSCLKMRTHFPWRRTYVSEKWSLLFKMWDYPLLSLYQSGFWCVSKFIYWRMFSVMIKS